MQPWGWTWIDDAAWGFAPFHYGRWVQVRSRWAWWPGPYSRRPAYAPALVAWFNRPGVSISISTGPSVGWFPLAPREHYLPRYSNNVNYIRNINYVTNNITVINPPTRYANQLPGATIVNNNVFHGGQQISRHVARVPPSVISAQRPGSGADFGPRFDRRENGNRGNGNGNGERDRRGDDDRRPRPSFAPVPPVLPAQNVRPGQGRGPVFDSPQPSKPAPQPARGGALPVTGVQPGGFPTPQPPRTNSAPVPAQTMPLQNPSAPSMPSMDSRPANVAPVAPVAPVNRDATNRSTSNDNRQRGDDNSQRPRRERPTSERVPTQPQPPVTTEPANRSMGDRAPQAQPQQQQQQAPKPHAARENATHPVAAPVVKEKPVSAAKEPGNDGRNKPREAEK